VRQDGGVTSETPTPPRRLDGSMSLLVDMMTNTLDESYAEAARRRAAAAGGDADAGRPGTSRRTVVVVLLVLLGLVTGTAAAQVRSRARAGNAVRQALVADVLRRTAESDSLARQADRLRASVAAARTAALTSGSAGRSMAQQLAALELAAGVDRVTGPGLVVRLDDAPGASGPDAPRGGQVADGRVLDRDLQDAVNGLWAAGAEAISINGLRLTARTAIRSAGEAILVDYRPLSPPYTIRALGDPAALEPGFADGAAGRRLATYTSLYGIRLTIARSARQTLPGAGEPVLRYAVPTRSTS
jgi:uncharacterized protein YlxW (UPF0749 family)